MTKREETRAVPPAGEEAAEIAEQYAALLDTMEEGVVITRGNATRYANRAFREMTGWVGVPAENMPSLLAMIMPAFGESGNGSSGGEGHRPPLCGEYRIQCRDGEIKHVQITSVPVPYEGASADLSVVRDITEYRRIEVALLESEEKFRVILDSTRTPIVYYDLEGNVLLINQSGAAIMGGVPEDFIGRRVHDIFPKEGRAILRRVKRVAEGGRGREFEDSVVLPIGERWFLSSFQPVRDVGGKVFAVMTVSHDVTERKRLAEAWRDFSRRLVEAQEQERRSVARELHDQIGQNLTALKLLLGPVLSRSAPENAGVIAEARRLIDELVGRVREISLDLRPSMLDDLGLLPALLWLVERYESQTGVRVIFKHMGLDRSFPPSVATAVYRIVQESLTNVARHARTDRAVVTVMAGDETLTVHIRDEGIGFDPGSAGASEASCGLIGMRERAQSLGGELVVSSMPGSGTDVVARIPLGLSEK